MISLALPYVMGEIKTMNTNPEILVGLSIPEMEALADSLLAPAAQHRLDELLALSKVKQLNSDDVSALDSLLSKIDQLTILKARARLTLDKQRAAAAGT
jgi:hypothetical protein